MNNQQLLKKLFPICRSITGKGIYTSLKILKNHNKKIKIKYFKTGKNVFDWKIPSEWNIKNAYVKDSKGTKLINFEQNNLHVISYSKYINKKIKKEELLKKIYFLKKQPDAIPYITSYYKKDWGFCCNLKTYNKIKNNKSEIFDILIDSSFNKNGKMHYGELLLKGKSKKEIILSTYLCHPSMANNELSGPVVLSNLIKYFANKKLNYSMRFLILPETIGTISYLNKNSKKLKENFYAGYVLTCLGDGGEMSFLKSIDENSISNKLAINYFKKSKTKVKYYNFVDRGSDERQYNSPKINLDMASLMRTKYGKYKEYHTSLDNLKFIKLNKIKQSINTITKILQLIQSNITPEIKTFCEPHLSKYGLYPTLSRKNMSKGYNNILNFVAYANGKRNLHELSDLLKIPYSKILKLYKLLKKKKIVI